MQNAPFKFGNKFGNKNGACDYRQYAAIVLLFGDDGG